MTTSTPTRRQRLRTATVVEIKECARRHLTAGGPSAISLRAIARDMGMTAPAIYRYFPSLDALVRELVLDLFTEVRLAVEDIHEPSRPPGQSSDPLADLIQMTRAFRRWSLAHPDEFELMFGRPLPGRREVDDECELPEHPANQFGMPFLYALNALWQQRPWPTPPAAILDERLPPSLGPAVRILMPEIPIEVIFTYLDAWMRLYGMVSMEVFGHAGWAVADADSFFELQLIMFSAQLRG